MKKQTRQILTIILAIVALFALVALAACTTAYSVTLDFGLENVENVTIQVKSNESLLLALESKRPLGSGFFFDGWYLPDGSKVTENTTVNGDVTVKAKWLATYRIEYYLENIDGEFTLSAVHTQTNLTAELGSTVTAEAKQIEGYTFDEGNGKNVVTAALNANGVTLKLYYTLNTVTVSFDSGLLTSVTGTTSSKVAFAGQPVELPQCGFVPTKDGFEFAGWTDGDATYSAGEQYSVTTNTTLHALWRTGFSEEIWIEKDEGGYELTATLQRKGILGATVTSTSEPSQVDTSKYKLDATVPNSVTSGVISEEGLKLKSYFAIRSFSVTYVDINMELGEPTYYKYGQTHTVITPTQNSNAVILRYSTSRAGNGVAYEFGDVITVTSDIVLYPIIEDIYTDEAGSGDRLVVYRGMTGWGMAKLTVNGTVYNCRVDEHKTNGHYEFYYYLDEQDDSSVVYGILLEGNLFRYRNDEEMGYFVNYDFVTDEFYGYYMLFDGYGFGGLSIPANDGTGRYLTYWLEYESVSTSEYKIKYYLPTDLEKYNIDYIIIADVVPEGSDEYDGSFVVCGDEGYVGYFFLLDNGHLSSYSYLYLDGYGYAELWGYNSYTEQDELLYTGVYIASENYYLYGDMEYIFVAEGVGEQFHFIWQVTSVNEEVVGYYMVRNEDMYGTFTSADGSDAELYLDGYAGVVYYSNDRDNGRIGSYTYSDGEEDQIILKIEFSDYLGGTMTALLNLEDRTFSVAPGGFIIDENGVLTGYEGTDTVIVIPEGVVEIAAGVFSATNIDVNITSVTFPASLKKIGDYAFSNGNASGASPLMTAIFNGETPPELGADVFRWIKGYTFKIIVPDGCEQAYRTAPTWTAATASQPNGYQQFVTSRAEMANKPEYEVVNGVLLSYNNKDADPTNVHIVIPGDVTTIASGVFAGLQYIVSVDLANVTEIGANAFYGCSALQTVKFSPNTKTIGARAFYECTRITSVNLGAVETIGDEAFSRCFGLSTVNIGNKIQSIGNFAFYMCSQDVSADETVIVLHDLIVNIAATTAPEMGRYVFQGSQPRVYVPTYEVGVSYADNTTWISYLKHLRVKSSSAATWYSVENLGLTLELGDNAIFDAGSMMGLYKWVDNTLYITWFNFDATSNTLTIIENVKGTLSATGELRNIQTDDSTKYTFIKQGETRTYSKELETFEVTFGADEAKFNGYVVSLTIGYRTTTFEYDGFIYTVTLYSDYTFRYATEKITVITTYHAQDGSEITVHDGKSIYVYGTLTNVDGQSFTTEVGWYGFRVSENVFWFTKDWLNTRYTITVYLNPADNSFTYVWTLGSTNKYYRDGNGNVATVTVTNGQVTSIRILFKTASGTEEVSTTFVKLTDNTFTVTVNAKVTDYDEEGNPHERDSEFNGTYTLTLNEDETFTLVKA